jgi:hypothetical protein
MAAKIRIGGVRCAEADGVLVAHLAVTTLAGAGTSQYVYLKGMGFFVFVFCPLS